MRALLVRRMKLVFAVAGTMLVATFLIIMPVGARPSVDDDASATFKSKCAMCHGTRAEKKFEATKADDELVQAVLKGKKMEKPPNMPGFEERGITSDQAKALVVYMKSIK
jgi:mono/diheme cytochrome c family protein